MSQTSMFISVGRGSDSLLRKESIPLKGQNFTSESLVILLLALPHLPCFGLSDTFESDGYYSAC